MSDGKLSERRRGSAGQGKRRHTQKASSSHKGQPTRRTHSTQKAQPTPPADAIPVGATATVTVERLNDDGDGVAKLSGWTVFIPMALPGETPTVEVTEVQKRHLIAKVIGHPAGPYEGTVRSEPPCGIYEACGGCQLQHISYQAQLDHKRHVVLQALRRIGKLENISVQPTIGMSDPWRYRNQIQVPLRYDLETRTLVPGFFARKSHDIVPTDACFLAPEAMEQTLGVATRTLARVLKHEASAVHHLVIRQSHTTGEQLLVLCLRRDLGDALRRVAEELMVSPVVGVVYTVQPSETGPVWGPSVVPLAGKEDLIERLSDVEFLVSPRSFFQVNTEQAEVLVRWALTHANPSSNHRVLDAYSGTGTFGLTLARQSKEVVGVEEIRPAVMDARRNAVHNGILNARFAVGQTEVLVPKWTKDGERFDVALLDPPRKGCHKDVLDALITAQIPRIVYVSCNPATLARDLRMLVDAGYEIQEVQPVDMFPHTSHIECCTLLVRTDAVRGN